MLYNAQNERYSNFLYKQGTKSKSMVELDTVAFLLTVNKVMSMGDREKVAKYLMQRKGELLQGKE